ncbi:hypothetical protein EYC08_19040 [Tabrizicola sp. WMC-M-20]|nr:hypothetical protein EYC08_19040 [Tabrizicola sp. WMC-M-20]
MTVVTPRSSASDCATTNMYFSRHWKKLRYDTELGGYVTDISQSQLEGAPSRPDDWRDNRDWATKNDGYATHRAIKTAHCPHAAQPLRDPRRRQTA